MRRNAGSCARSTSWVQLAVRAWSNFVYLGYITQRSEGHVIRRTSRWDYLFWRSESRAHALARSLAVLTVIMCCGSALCSGVFSYAQARSSSFLRSYKTSLCIIVGAVLLHSTVRRSSVCTSKTSAHSSFSINLRNSLILACKQRRNTALLWFFLSCSLPLFGLLARPSAFRL